MIILCLSIYVYFTQKQEIGESVLDRTQQGIIHLNAYLKPLVGTQEKPDKLAISRALEEFSERSIELKHGRYVYLRLLEHSGELVAEVSYEPYSLLEEVQTAVASEPLSYTGSIKDNIYLLDIQGNPHLRILLPLDNKTQTSRTYYADLVFAVSDEMVASVHSKIVTTILFISGIIIATTLILYPVIFNLMRRLSRLSLELLEANIDTLNVLGSAIAKRDSDTDAHNYRVTIMSVRLAEKIDLPSNDIRCLIKGAFLHDVGKIGIPDHILLKPGRLDEDEFNIMRTHVEHGLDIINSSKWLKEAAAVTGSHHEKYDGQGYPAGQKGGEVPIVARIFAITDVFDALSSKRPYKEAMPYDKVIRILEEGRGNHFDPDILDTFFLISEKWSTDLASMDTIKLKDELSEIVQKYFLDDIISMF